MWLYDSQDGSLYSMRGALLRVFIWWTRIAYRRLARQVIRDVTDYERSGITVGGIVGIGTSPSCGVCDDAGPPRVIGGPRRMPEGAQP